ncbi:MAG TPA: hypothetical protein VIT92_03325 [Burkholderiaceae bacterium]
MKRHVISRDIREFLQAHIYSVAMLEGLLLLHKTPHQVWTLPDFSQRLYLSQQTGAEVLAQLRQGGFCAGMGQDIDGYRYLPGSDGRRLLIERVAATYESNLIGLTNLIHSNLPEEKTLRERALGRYFRRRDDLQRFC